MTVFRCGLLLSAWLLGWPALAATDAAGQPTAPAAGVPGGPARNSSTAPFVQPALPPPPAPRPGSLLKQPLLRANPAMLADPAVDALPPLREWLVISRNLGEAESQRKALLPWRLSILRRQQLQHLQQVISVYRIPPEVDLLQLEQQLRRQFPDWQQELNQRYQPLQDAAPEAAEQQLRRWGQQAVGQLQRACLAHEHAAHEVVAQHPRQRSRDGKPGPPPAHQGVDSTGQQQHGPKQRG